ncbi:hypothetical protein ON010_g15296 [Phytophthora cinnamomi]|nr:hypothetical protein ON010_g15296 [Phytophthora cinnamomi]
MHPAFNHFSSLPLESLAIKREATANPIILPAGDEMLQHNDNNYQQWFGGPEPTIAAKTVDTNVQPLLWVPTEAGIATVGDSQPSSQALDELLQHDDAVEWRTPNDFEGDSNSVGYALDDAGMAPSLL